MVTVNQINPSEEYNVKDEALISSFEIDTSLTSSSYIEYNVYDLNNNLLFNNYNYLFYRVQNDGTPVSNNETSKIIIDPAQDLTKEGFTQGEYNTYYTPLNKHLGSPNNKLYISEISSDRTELRLDSNTLDESTLIDKTNNFIQERESSGYFFDFYLNFGEDKLVLANNIKSNFEDINNPTVLIKLYEPLPEEFDLKSELWVVSTIDEKIGYNVVFEEEPIIIQDSSPLRGPNLNLEIKDQINNSTVELSYTDLITTTLTSSQDRLNNLLNEKEIKINIDYTSYDNFVHFSSAQTRLDNFYYKASLLESYSASIAIINSDITGSTSSSIAVSESKAIFEDRASKVIANFDGYDHYLYYESGSKAWPKTNSTPPYNLATTGSSELISWFGSVNENSPNYGGQILSASLYDENNKDNLVFSIPEYLREDSENAAYELFVNMLGQHYDNVWVYIKDVTQKFNADNRLNYGVSKDLVADAIRNFGVKLYQNNFSNEDLFTAFMGITSTGSLFPFPNTTGSLNPPTGYEYIDTRVSASNDYIPLDDVNKSLYKRLYHNIPYLLKAKGTVPGLRALITSYGIPDTILKISEFGGKDKVNTNDWDYYYNKFNYKWDTNGNNYAYTFWETQPYWNASNDRPSSVMFRFKTEDILPTNLSQSLWCLDDSNTSSNIGVLSLQYSGSGLTSGSYSGSIIDPQYQYADLKFYPSSSDLTVSASINLPFFNGDWWSVMINSGSNGFELFAKNKTYNGNDGTSIGFQASSSITSSYNSWSGSNYSSFGNSSTLGNPFSLFSGSFQEVRYYVNAISESVFDDYVMNPLSIEGNSINSSPNELLFRAALGSELAKDTTTTGTSIHPYITGSWAISQSFVSAVNGTPNSAYTFRFSPAHSSNTEYYFLDQPIAGIKNRITDKIRVESNTLPSGDTLSPLRRVSQMSEASSSYTPHLNLLEVAFSPQNEINDDIINQIGYFNIGDYIGDPRFRSSSLNSYPELDNLRDSYFEKYLNNYNVFDFVHLIKYFDNSLFKMIKDFVPARTSLASGVVIKQHLLERNRYKHVNATSTTTVAKYLSGSSKLNDTLDYQSLTISGTIQPQWNNYNSGKILNPSGSAGGGFATFNLLQFSPSGSEGNGPNNIYNITQSWAVTTPSISGSVTTIHSSQDEFYNGEFSGSKIVVTTQNLNADCDYFKRIDPVGVEYHGIRMYSGSEYSFGGFISTNNEPTDGYISIWYNNPNTILPPVFGE